ncbi:MAG: hypothetical protein NTV97_00295 [Alphaproteobacteria bacterium]|nr:hypothetical protein [Alphaproteobacteria bacterium]
MAKADSLSGVRKWLDREEWQERFDELIGRHLLKPCEEAGIELDELRDIIGGNNEANLYGCVFEDMLAAEFEDGRNVVDDYLKRRGWKESVPNKRYMTALRSSVMSLYEVSDIVRDQSFLARDLLRGGEPIRVSEKLGTRSLRPWDWIALRLVKMGARTEMAGGFLPMGREAGEGLRDGFLALRQELPAEFRELVLDGRDEAELGAYEFDTEILRSGAFLFTNVWLDDALQRVLDPEPPRMVNADGDEIAYTVVRYPLKEGADPAALEAGLTATPELRRTSEDHWTWVGTAAQGIGRASGNILSLNTTLDDGTVSLGDIRLRADTLELEVNSPQRAQKGQELLEPVIGPFVGEPTVDTRAIAESMASRPMDESELPASGLSPEEEGAIVHQALDRHYRGILSKPIPALGDMSPREAAKTKEGRELLADWLKYIENSNAGQKPGSAIRSYDTSWLWEELGVADLRR